MLIIIRCLYKFYPSVSYVYADDGNEAKVDADVYKLYSEAKAEAETVSINGYNSSTSDYDRLLYFKNYICEATHYNFDAAENGSYTTDNSPWQIIEVFYDTDADGVVCEGYSKAFQLLYDNIADNDDVKAECYTVSGVMDGGTGAGNHMWNIVKMGNGKNYIVDVTNCDAGTVGQNGELFLAGATGSVENGYTVTVDGREILYCYNEDTKSNLAAPSKGVRRQPVGVE